MAKFTIQIVKKIISDWRLLRGFSLIELLVVFVLIGISMVTSIAAFYSYNKSQSYITSVSDVVHYLNLAKSRARSQVKPSLCGTKTLKYYQVYFVAPGSTYRLKVLCDTTLITLESKTLPTGVTFTDASPISVNFLVSTGIPMQARIIHIAGPSKNTTITINEVGVISSQ